MRLNGECRSVAYFFYFLLSPVAKGIPDDSILRLKMRLSFYFSIA